MAPAPQGLLPAICSGIMCRDHSGTGETVRSAKDRSWVSHVRSKGLTHCLSCPSVLFDPQVDYGPCVVAGDCWNLLLEFLQSFLGSHTPGLPAAFGNRHDAVYSPADTMVQYMELFSKIRKQQQVPVAGLR